MSALKLMLENSTSHPRSIGQNIILFQLKLLNRINMGINFFPKTYIDQYSSTWNYAVFILKINSKNFISFLTRVTVPCVEIDFSAPSLVNPF